MKGYGILILFKFPTNMYLWNVNLFNQNQDVISQVDPLEQPLDATSKK